MSTCKVFIVEDDPWYGEILKYHLSLNEDNLVTVFTTAKECLDQLHQKPDVVTIDFHLPDMSGEELLKKIKAHNNAIPVIVISGQEEIFIALNMLKQGAYDYLVKNDNTKELLWNSIHHISENSNLKQEVESLREELVTKYEFQSSIIGQSAAIKRIFGLLEKAVKSNINVSITGETGTGKEVVAKAVHYNSERKKKPFIAVNMAAIPTELIESELFGHEKGAFTGALARKAGKFEEANGGTIFLDEIAELDLNLQSKLLRVLQEREVTRVGGNEIVKFDARLLIATHKNLSEEVQKGKFREDLYYRIIGLPIELPPLRERGNDILLLAKHFTDVYAKENKTKAFSLNAEAREKLMKYNYPGNVRELKSVLDLACVMSDSNEIKPDDIQFVTLKENDIFQNVEKKFSEYEIDIIQFYLKKYNYNILTVANKLDISKSKIYNMVKSGAVKVNTTN